MDKLRKPEKRHGGSGSGAEGTQPRKKYWAYAAAVVVIVSLIIIGLCS